MSRRLLLVVAAVLAALGAWGQPQAQEVLPGIIYAVGEKFDRSFNEGAYNALEQYKAETGGEYLEYEPASVAEFEQGVAALARRGATIIFVVGFYYAEPLAQLAPRYPEVKFTLIDSVAEAPNVQSVLFREQEGSYLTGIIAAMTSQTGTIGFVAAIDIPLIRKFIVGFEEGAKSVNPDLTYLVNFVGTTPAAFNDPTRGAELARSQFERGADVVFAGAGASNFGVFQAAVDAGKFAIGVDSNQNHLHPGTILTSMLKRVDVAVLRALQAARDGSWMPGILSLGLAEDGVGWALDENNERLIPQNVRDQVEAARQAIIAGEIKVTDPTVAP